MKKTICAAGAVVLMVGVCAEDVFVGFNEEKSVKVEEGQTLVQTGLLDVDPGGGLYKTGPGTWQIPFSSLATLGDCCFGVMGGELWLTGGSVSLQTDVRPILNKAAFWVKADSGIIETNASSGPVASRWLDARETDLESPYSYPYAEPAWLAEQESDSLYGVPPAVTTLDDAFKAVYFGGYGRPQAMHWTKPEGGMFKAKMIQHVFAVMTLKDAMGQLIGNNAYPDGGALDFHRDLTGATYFSKRDNEPRCISIGARTYLNGNLIDGQTRHWVQGRQLLEIDLRERYGEASRFFSSGVFAQGKGRNGGDYLHEFLVFTNRLTAGECAAVRNHLMDRWQLDGAIGSEDAAESRMAIAEGATVKGSLEGEHVVPALQGDGTYVVSGGTQMFPAKVDSSHTVGVRVESGTGVLRSPLPVTVKGGDKITARYSEDGSRIWHEVDNVDSAVVEQTGSAMVSLLSVPEDVTAYRVDNGVLRLTSPSKADRIVEGEVVEAVIPNPSFEEGKDGITLTPFTGEKKNGWTGGGTYAAYYNRAKGNQWPTPLYSPDGDVSLALKDGGWACTEIHVPTSGVYRLSFKAAGRMNFKHQNHIEVLIGADATFGDQNSYVKLGEVYVSNETATKTYNDYSECVFKAKVDEGGNYYLLLRALAGSNINGTTLLDDFKMQRLVAVSADYEIPNGDFERVGLHPQHTWNDGIGNVWFDFNMDCEGWEFDQGPRSSVVLGGAHAVGVVFHGFEFRYPQNDINKEALCAWTSADFPYGRQALAMTSSGGVARITFTPPAGRYILVADGKCQQLSTGRWGDTYDQIPDVTATVTINGEKTELGSCQISNHRAKKLKWPKVFTVKEGESVTLAIEQLNSKAIAVLDNFRLSSNRADCNLIQNGSFEGALDGNWTVRQNKEHDDIGPNHAGVLGSNSNAAVIDVFNSGFTPEFGYEGGYGNRVCLLTQLGSVEQKVTFPVAGLYDLRFLTRSRPNGPSGRRNTNGLNPVRAWYSKDNGDGSVTTNVIGWTSVENTNFVAHAFQFRVAEAGEYTFALQGMNRTVNEDGAKNDRSSMVDGVSVTYAANAKDTPDLHENLSLVVEGGNSRLILDYPGTQEVFSVRIGGRSLVNEINATTCPGLVEGIGTLYVRPRGTIFMVR